MQRSGIPLNSDDRIAQISTHQISAGTVERTITRAQAHGIRDLVTNARCNIVSVVRRHHWGNRVAAKVARVRSECETAKTLGKAHCRIVFPVAIQAGDGRELTAHGGIDLVAVAKILDDAGTEAR